METKSIIKKIAQIAAIMLLCANITVVRAAEPKIIVSQMPLIGENGNAEGKIIWDELTAANAGQYAVIAMLHAGGYYVKPTYDNYLNGIDANGHFSIRLTTGGHDEDVDEIIFYLIERVDFSNADPANLNPTVMNGKYLTTTTIFRNNWVWPESNIPPGLVAAGTKITLSCPDGGDIYYTLDGSDPRTSPNAQTYNRQSFSVSSNGALFIKAAVRIKNFYGPVSSFVWLPKEPLTTPFWGLNVSLALNGEPFGYQLSEAATRERMLPVAKLTKWIRTFGTINNGQEYINKIAKEELGLHTMIGVYITNDASNNDTQIEGLRQILQKGPAPDLITIGNEPKLLGVDPLMLASYIDAIREMVLKQGLVIPIGTVDFSNTQWSQYVLERFDFMGVNIYNGTWDNVPENQMFDAMKQTYENSLSTFSSKLVLLTETGTPHNGGTYYFDGGTQTASKEKAAKYLCNFLDWMQQGDIPAFYFEAYDEPAKEAESGYAIEQYFGIMDGNMQIHSFYDNCIPIENAQTPIISTHPQSVTETVGTTYNLTVTASVTDDGILSYQWYSNTNNSNEGGTAISGATSTTYAAPINTPGTYSYYAIVTNTNNGVNGTKTAIVTSNVAILTVNALVDAQTPIITAHPQSATETVGSTYNLTVAANVTDDGTLSYQWYSNTNNSNEGGTAISGATSATYAAPINTPGTYYYYAIVTNTNNGVNGTKMAIAISNVAILTATQSVIAVTVSPATAVIQKSKTQQFIVIVEVIGGASTDVIWSLDGQELAATTISESGLLTIAENETASTLTVTATSVFDISQKGTATVTIEESTGVREILNDDIKIYPNPFTDLLYISGANGCMLKIIAENGSAVHIQQIINFNETIRLEKLHAGIYLILLEKDGKMRTMKIVKNKI